MDSKLHILFLGTEWGSSQEDISTLCRELAIHFAKCPGVRRVSFLVPPGKTAGEAKDKALNYNVHLVQAKDCPGMNKVHSLSFPPDSLGDVDVVIGCGLQLGPQAKCIKDMKQCHWVQFVHESSEELGMYKGIQEYEEKHKQEIELCRMADLVVTLGPKLFDSISAPLRPDTTVIELIPGLFEEFAKLTPAQKGTRVHKIFLFGNTDLEDFELKGFDVAAKAVGSMRQKKYDLIFVGAPEGRQDEVKNMLLQEGIARNQLKVRSFCESQESLSGMFLEADLCIMPSRTEGFGLTALKAMSAGTPILVSGNSGFGQALDKVNFGSSFIVDSDDPEVWRSKMEDVLEKERPQRLEEAARIRDAYSAKYSWKEDCNNIVKSICSGKVQDANGNVPHVQAHPNSRPPQSSADQLTAGPKRPDPWFQNHGNASFAGRAHPGTSTTARAQDFQQSAQQFSQEIKPGELRKLSKKVIDIWKDLAYELEVNEDSIKNISLNHGTLVDKAHEALQAWLNDCRKTLQRGTWARALRKHHKGCLADELEQGEYTT